MKTINLRDYYPFYKDNTYIEVSDEIAQQLDSFLHDDEAVRIRILRAKAYYSLNRKDGIEAEAMVQPEQPDEALERVEFTRIINNALSSLSETQQRRVYAYIFEGKSKVDIAKSEGVDERAVRIAIKRGLARLKIF
jgi:RNA polymerase sigma-70 factor (ECF subfamily)